MDLPEIVGSATGKALLSNLRRRAHASVQHQSLSLVNRLVQFLDRLSKIRPLQRQRCFLGKLPSTNSLRASWRSLRGCLKSPDSVIFHRLCFPIPASKQLGRTLVRVP